jgi:hypothetical protein
MRAPDPFRRAAVLALAWWLVGLGIDPGPGHRSAQGGRTCPRPAAADGWRAQTLPSDRAARLGQPTPTTQTNP